MLELFFFSFLFSHHIYPQQLLFLFCYHLTPKTIFAKVMDYLFCCKICWPLLSPFAVSQDHLNLRCSLLKTVLCPPLTHVSPPVPMLLRLLRRFLHALCLLLVLPGV